jgi:hypothetical protein
MGEVYTMAETARHLRCSEAHVRHILQGKVDGLPPLPVLRLGRRVLIRADVLIAWLQELERREIEAQKVTGFFR